MRYSTRSNASRCRVEWSRKTSCSTSKAGSTAGWRRPDLPVVAPRDRRRAGARRGHARASARPGARPAGRLAAGLRRLPRPAPGNRRRRRRGAGRQLPRPAAALPQQRGRRRRRHGVLLRQLDQVPHRALQARPARTPAHRPGADELTLIADGLYFPNGVALTPDDSALLVVETGTYTLSRIELTGTSAGRRQPLAANLPGLPDNLSAVGDDTYWIALGICQPV